MPRNRHSWVLSLGLGYVSITSVLEGFGLTPSFEMISEFEWDTL